VQAAPAGLAKASTQKTRVPARLQTQVAAKPTRQAPAEPAPSAAKSVAFTAKAPNGKPAAAPETQVAEAGPVNPLPGPFHIQIGAFPSEAEARQKLTTAMGLGSTLLAGHAAGAVSYAAPDRVWYRARFSGFDRAAADKTCLTLRAKRLDCIVMQAN